MRGSIALLAALASMASMAAGRTLDAVRVRPTPDRPLGPDGGPGGWGGYGGGGSAVSSYRPAPEVRVARAQAKRIRRELRRRREIRRGGWHRPEITTQPDTGDWCEPPDGRALFVTDPMGWDSQTIDADQEPGPAVRDENGNLTWWAKRQTWFRGCAECGHAGFPCACRDLEEGAVAPRAVAR